MMDIGDLTGARRCYGVRSALRHAVLAISQLSSVLLNREIAAKNVDRMEVG